MNIRLEYIQWCCQQKYIQSYKQCCIAQRPSTASSYCLTCNRDFQLHLDYNTIIFLYALMYVQMLGTIIYISYKLPWTHYWLRQNWLQYLLKFLFILPLELLDQSILFLFRKCIEHENWFVTNVILNGQNQNETVRVDWGKKILAKNWCYIQICHWKRIYLDWLLELPHSENGEKNHPHS